MTNVVERAGKAGLVLAIVAIGASALGHAQSRAVQSRAARRGAPTDWSHSHLIASRFGPDLDKAIARDWRTYNKHVRRDLAQASSEQTYREQASLLNLFRGVARPSPVRQPPMGDRTAPHLDWFLNTGGYGPVVGDPAKYSFDIASANCADVIYFTVNQAGSATAANVIAITNPYSTCPGNAGGTTPTVKFALRLTSGTATSAVPSLDGTILYVLESRAASTILHAIKVNNITTSPGTYNFVTNLWTTVHTLLNSPIGTAASEQLFELTFAGTVNNVSSPYLDYSNNQIFFGDAAGKLHRVINTHLATASEYLALGFPVQCGAAQLTSPVFVTAPVGQLFVSSANGYLYRIDLLNAPSPNYVAIRAAQSGTGLGAAGGLSSPVIDITNNKIILTTGDAFVAPGLKGIGTFDLMFLAGALPTSQQALGAGDGFATTTPAFDDAFWSSNNGNAYATGNSSGGGNTYLIKIPYNGAFSVAPTGFAALRHTGGAAAVQTTGVTEFLTASAGANKDFIFVGASGGSYLYMNRFLSNFGGTDATPGTYTGSFVAPGGVSSGVVIDNRTGFQITTGLSTANIYYGTKGVGPATTMSRVVQLNQEF